MGRKEEVLDAAIVVLAGAGTRGLTHGAVDREAGVPAGTTSNHFRSRASLLQGIVRRLNERFVGQIEAGTLHGPRDQAELVARLAGAVAEATDPDLPNGVAFFMLNYEAASNPSITGLLTEAMQRFETVLAGWLGPLGSTEPERDALLLGQYARGLIVNQRTVPDPDFDPARALEPMVHSLLR